MKPLALSFRHRLLLGAVLPALLMVSALEWVFLQRYRHDIEQTFIDRGRAIVHQLGVASEYALFSGSYATLDMLATGLRQSESDIVSVSVLDHSGKRLAGSGERLRPQAVLEDRLLINNGAVHVTIQAPIYRTALSLDAEPWESPPTHLRREVIGYVVIEIARTQLRQRQNEMLRITLSIMLGGLLLAGWVSARIADDVLGRLDAARRDLLRQKEIAEALARTDALTGLANRRAFDEAAQLEIRRAQRYGTALAMVMTDLDRFKSINDTHGHHVGDRVLVDFAQTLLASVRDVDLVGRWGGEEFVILMPGTALDEAARVAERMRLAVAGAPTRCEGKICGYTASFGVAVLSAERQTVDALLGAADVALYRAKAHGRNRVELEAE